MSDYFAHSWDNETLKKNINVELIGLRKALKYQNRKKDYYYDKINTHKCFYGILGLVLGVYYRELTKMNDFTGTTQLGTSHTHAFALGMLVFLIVLLLEANFKLSEQGKTYRLFYIFIISD